MSPGASAKSAAQIGLEQDRNAAGQADLPARAYVRSAFDGRERVAEARAVRGGCPVVFERHWMVLFAQMEIEGDAAQETSGHVSRIEIAALIGEHRLDPCPRVVVLAPASSKISTAWAGSWARRPEHPVDARPADFICSWAGHVGLVPVRFSMSLCDFVLALLRAKTL
jgi:hypothetical protein